MSGRKEKEARRSLADAEAQDERRRNAASRMEALLGRAMVEGLCNHGGPPAPYECRWCCAVEETLRFIHEGAAQPEAAETTSTALRDFDIARAAVMNVLSNSTGAAKRWGPMEDRLRYFLPRVMRRLQGRANPQVVSRILSERLAYEEAHPLGP